MDTVRHRAHTAEPMLSVRAGERPRHKSDGGVILRAESLDLPPDPPLIL